MIEHFDADCNYLGQLPSSPPLQHPDFRAGLAIDAPCLGTAGASCDLGGYHSPEENEHNVYVGSGETQKASHLFTYRLREGGPPAVDAQAASDIGDREAMLRAQLNPNGLPTTYRFEYISEADYEANGDEFGPGGASLPAGEIAPGTSFVAISKPLTGLASGTTYRFRLVAENEAGTTAGEGNQGGVGTDATFTTYLSEAGGLPDHRGYELVTPPRTGGYVPTMNELGFTPFAALVAFPTDFAGPGAESLLFGIEGGSLPDLPGSGFHDTYGGPSRIRWDVRTMAESVQRHQRCRGSGTDPQRLFLRSRLLLLGAVESRRRGRRQLHPPLQRCAGSQMQSQSGKRPRTDRLRDPGLRFPGQRGMDLHRRWARHLRHLERNQPCSSAAGAPGSADGHRCCL